MTNNNLQNTTQTIKDRATQFPLKSNTLCFSSSNFQQEKSSDLAESMIDKLDKLSETSSKEDVLEASTGILSTLANVQEVSL